MWSHSVGFSEYKNFENGQANGEVAVVEEAWGAGRGGVEEGTNLCKVKGLANLARSHLLSSSSFGESCLAWAPALLL